MRVTVDLAGGESREVELEGGTYADLLEPFDVSVHEVSFVVGGRTVPEDETVSESVEHVQVIRLIKGG